MKKILQRTFLGVLALIIVSVSIAVAVRNNANKPVTSSIVTDAAGSTYRVHIEKDTTYAVVTDENGDIWGADFDGNTVDLTGTRVNLNEKYNSEDIPTQFTGEHVDYTVDPNAYLDNPNPKPDNQPQQGGSENQGNENEGQIPPEVPDNGLEAYRIQKYQDVITGGTYLMTVTMIENGVQEEPITMAVKNGNVYISMNVDDMSAQMIYKAENDTMYMLLDFIKKYCEVPEDMMGGEMNMAAIATDFNVGKINEVSVEETELNGNKVICESYIADDGSEFRYYFDQNDMLVRRDKFSPNGNTDMMLFSQLTTDVDDSLFEIPKGYGYLNISWLLSMAQ